MISTSRYYGHVTQLIHNGEHRNFCPSQGVVSCEKMADDSEKRLEVLEELHEQDVVQC